MSQSIACPACRGPDLTTRVERLDIPYFGEAIELVVTCDNCGFRRADFHITKESDPVRYTLHVKDESDLHARVVRSATGHFAIPELGIRAEPSEAADAFVSNVEGVLDRCENAIRISMRGQEDAAKLRRAEELMELAEQLRATERPWTLIIEDPLGNSAIASDNAEREALGPEEAEALGLPYMVIDMDDLRRAHLREEE